MKKIKIIILLIFIFLLNIQDVFAYDEIFKINDEKNEYNDVAYTSNGGCVVVGNWGHRIFAYIAVYNINGEKVKENIYDREFTNFYSVIETSDNGYIAVGKNTSNYSNALIVKFDSELNVLWEKEYNGSKDERFNSVIETSDGNIIAVGIADQENGNIKPAKGLIVKYDKNGNQLWANTIGGTSYDLFNSVIETSDNCYIVVGTFKSKDLENLEINGEADAIVFKYNSDGELLWKKSYGGSSYDGFTSIIKSNDGGYIAVGTTASQDIEDITDREQWKCLIVKYDENFNVVWNKGHGSGHQSEFLSVVELSNKDIVAVGETYSISPTHHGILIQYDSEGKFVYSEEWPTIETEPRNSTKYPSIAGKDNSFIFIDSNLFTETSKIIKYSYDSKKEEEKTADNSSKENREKEKNGKAADDLTIAKRILPNTGSDIYIIGLILIIIIGVGIVSYIKNKHTKIC